MGRAKRRRRWGDEIGIDGATLLRVYNAHITRLDALIAEVDENDLTTNAAKIQDLLEMRLLRGFQVSGLDRKKRYSFFPHEFTELFYVDNKFVPGLVAILNIPVREHPMLDTAKQEQATDLHD